MQPWQYIVLAGAVILVGAFIMPRKKQEGGQSSQSVRNMETALDHFMENMEKDNEQLLTLVAEAQQSSRQEAAKKDERIAALEQRCEQLEKLLLESVVKPAAAGALEPELVSVRLETPEPSQDTTKEGTIHARYAELFKLYGDGKSIEAIAKKLGMNKGEVQLIIGLSRQEEAARV